MPRPLVIEHIPPGTLDSSLGASARLADIAPHHGSAIDWNAAFKDFPAAENTVPLSKLVDNPVAGASTDADSARANLARALASFSGIADTPAVPPSTTPKDFIGVGITTIDADKAFAGYLRSPIFKLRRSVQQTPGNVLASLSPEAGRIARDLTPEQQRRALVVMTHDENVSIGGTRKSAPVTDEEILDITQTVCMMVAESALPTDAAPRSFSVIADSFVQGLETARDIGPANMDRFKTMVWARAAVALNDPAAHSTVSNIVKHKDIGTVSFRLATPQFSTAVTYDVVNFAQNVAKAPNRPDVDQLALYPGVLK